MGTPTISFYTVSDKYITFLKTIDNRVSDNKNRKRPYVGVVLEINEHRYLAPLTSQEKKFNSQTTIKIYDKDNYYCGAVLLNNMIPVLEYEIQRLVFKDQTPQYEELLKKQQLYLRKKREDIYQKADKLRTLVIEKKTSYICKICCDFQVLESHYRNYPNIKKQI